MPSEVRLGMENAALLLDVLFVVIDTVPPLVVKSIFLPEFPDSESKTQPRTVYSVFNCSPENVNVIGSEVLQKARSRRMAASGCPVIGAVTPRSRKPLGVTSTVMVTVPSEAGNDETPVKPDCVLLPVWISNEVVAAEAAAMNSEDKITEKIVVFVFTGEFGIVQGFE